MAATMSTADTWGGPGPALAVGAGKRVHPTKRSAGEVDPAASAPPGPMCTRASVGPSCRPLSRPGQTGQYRIQTVPAMPASQTGRWHRKHTWWAPLDQHKTQYGLSQGISASPRGVAPFGPGTAVSSGPSSSSALP